MTGVKVLELLLADGRFPGGGFAHSGGLEPAVGEGAVGGVDELAAFLAGRVSSGGPVEGWAAAQGCRAGAAATGGVGGEGGGDGDGGRWAALEAEVEAHQPSPALRGAWRVQGRGLRRSAAVIWPAVAGLTAEVHPVVLGAVAAAAGLEPPAAARLAVHGILMTACTAAPKLLAVDTADALRVAVALAPLVEEVAAGAATAERCPIGSAVSSELRAERHARWEVRLFAS